MFQDRVLSGMRPTGAMHLGHYHGALKNWVTLQNEYPCFFFAADWHALTTHYEDPAVIEQTVWEMSSTGSRRGRPGKATLFIPRACRSTPSSRWLSFFNALRGRGGDDDKTWGAARERGATSTYGSRYPLRAPTSYLPRQQVPVGEDSVEIELTREDRAPSTTVPAREGFEGRRAAIRNGRRRPSSPARAAKVQVRARGRHGRGAGAGGSGESLLAQGADVRYIDGGRMTRRGRGALTRRRSYGRDGQKMYKRRQPPS